MPLAAPSVSGTVYRDNNGSSTIDGGGTGGGVWNTANALWVNAVRNNVVIATASVNGSGVFNFPAGGQITEGDVITFQLSQNQGTIGQLPPAKVLPTGWATVGESITGGPSDGTPDGEFILTIGNVNSTTNRFGVTTCAASTQAPLVNNNISNLCPATTVNLNLAHTGTIPTGTNLVWFTNSNHTGAALSGPQVTQAGTRTYYAFY